MNNKEIIEKVREIPLNQIISSILAEVRPCYQNDPSQKDFLCPFHNDHNGNHFFIYSDRKGVERWHCFVCEKSGDGISFVQTVRKCDFLTAVYELAVRFEIITKEEYTRLTHEKFTQSTTRVSYRATQNTNLAHVRTAQELNLIYSWIAKGPSLLNPSQGKLSKQDLDYLHSRHIEDKEIALYGYFTMPNEEIMPKLIELLHEHDMQEDFLIGVPGFWREKESGKIHMLKMEGIGIPIRDKDRNCVAIQVRSNEVEPKGSRYKFLSSKFVNGFRYKDLYDGGCGPSKTVSVVWPYEMDNLDKYIFITEGVFKAAQLALEFKSSAISVQGVNNTKDVIPTLEDISEKLKFSDKQKVVLCFDMDMYDNIHVLKAAFKLRKELENAGWEVLYAHWNRSFKGIDDFLIQRRLTRSHEHMILEPAKNYEEMLFLDALKGIIGNQNALSMQDDQLTIGDRTIHVDRDSYFSIIKKIENEAAHK